MYMVHIRIHKGNHDELILKLVRDIKVPYLGINGCKSGKHHAKG